MSINTDPKKIDGVLQRRIKEVIVYEHLKTKLGSGKKLRIKFGIDPTSTDLHIGHAVPLRKLREFQEMGHQAILLIGDYTARIGDPSGRNETRPILTQEQVEKNMQTYIDQAKKILDMQTLEIRYNSEWYKDKRGDFMMELTGKITVARVLERDDFQKRLKEGSDIQMQEILYPLLQGYDSVALQADVELGGFDQKFNLMMGRKIQKRYDQEEQDIMTVPLLEGIDGEKKMSKSYGNFIALTDSPEDMFGKVMAIPDTLMLRYFELATDVPVDTIQKYNEELKAGRNPRDIKMVLAYEITRLYHGDEAAKQGREHFARVIQSDKKPTEISELKPSAYDIATVLVEAGFCSSRGDARRQIEGKGVKVNDVVVESVEMQLKAGNVLQKGKRFFVKIK